MKRLAVAIYLSSLGFVFPALAQTATSSSAVKDPTAVAVAQKALSAMGGGALKSYQDSFAQGSITFIARDTKETSAAVIKSKGANKYRWEISSPQGANLSISDGTSGCKADPVFGRKKVSSVDLLSKRVDHIPALSLLGEYSSGSMNVQSGGTAMVNGALADVVALSLQLPGLPANLDSSRLTQHLFFVDRVSGQVSKMQFTTFEENGVPGSKIEMIFSDYRNVAGISVPFKRTLYVDGELASELTLASIVFNSGLPDTDFALGCGVRQ